MADLISTQLRERAERLRASNINQASWLGGPTPAMLDDAASFITAQAAKITAQASELRVMREALTRIAKHPSGNDTELNSPSLVRILQDIALAALERKSS